MQQSISNEFLEVIISDIGAEITSIKSQKSGLEYMWQADPNIWNSSAPVLFPAIGAFKNGESVLHGQKYSVPRHGFVRHNKALKVISQTPQSVTYQLTSSAELLEVYPFEFDFQIQFSLLDNQLVVNHQVLNKDNKEMLFCLGGHPAFRCPMHKNESYEDYYLEFEHHETVETTVLSKEGLLTDQKKSVLKNSNILPLDQNMFDQDALIFQDLKSNKVSLKSNQSNQVLTVEYEDFPFLGLWAKPRAPFICIEPWLGIADHEDTDGCFTSKLGVVSILPGAVFHAKYKVQITD